MNMILIKALLLITLLIFTSCSVKVGVPKLPPSPPKYVSMTPLLVNSGQALTNGVTSITSPSGGPYQIAYSSSTLFYTTGNATNPSTRWNSFLISNFGNTPIIATAPYYVSNNAPQLLVLTYNASIPGNQLWLCSNLDTAVLSCTQNSSALPNTLPIQNLNNILGNNGISYAVLDDNTLMMSLNGNNYQIMPNIPTMPNNTPIATTTVDIAGNLYVVFNSSTIGPVLYEFNISNKKWSMILQNQQLVSGPIAVDAGRNIYLLSTANTNGTCVNNQVNFTIQYVTGNSLSSQRMTFSGCSNQSINFTNISVDANSEVYVSLENGNIGQVAYSDGKIIY